MIRIIGVCVYFEVVDPQRFELWEVWPSPVFKTGAFDQLCQRSTFVVMIIYYKIGGATQIWTGDSSFAGCGLTTWRWHQSINFSNGARGRTWTGTVLLPGDFKSPASTDFATRALGVYQQFIISNGAGNEVRTRDPNLGKVVLYHWAIPAILHTLSFWVSGIIATYFSFVKSFYPKI